MGDRSLRIARFFLVGATAMACAAACGTSFPPQGDDGNRLDTSSNGVCTPGTAGCPCATAGETAQCGDVVQRSGDYVTCSMGQSACTGGTWGPCIGHNLVIKNLASTSLGAGGLRFDSLQLQCADAGAGGTNFNPCDPNPGCTVITGQPGDVDASGVVATEGGISLGTTDGATSDAQPVTCSGTGLACQVAYCANDAGSGTTISGTVYDPAGNNPLYNVIVYVPNDPKGKLSPFPAGVQCSQCASSQSLAASLGAVTATYTDVNGHFTLTNAPSGSDIPIVVQSGKWRREILLTSVTQCAANLIPAAGATTGPGSCTWTNANDVTRCQLHLPRNQYDGYDYVKADGATYGRADLPQIAIVTGSADPLECILLKAGVDPSEVSSYDKDLPLTATTTHHHIHFFESDQAPGASLDPSYGTNQKGSVLWLDHGDPAPTAPTPPHYDYYDLVMLPCEGDSLDKHSLYTSATTQGEPYANIIKYADMGGRIFTTHFGYTWLQYPGRSPSGSNLPYVAAPDNWGGLKGVADWTHSTGTVDTSDPLTSTVITTFPKGAIFSQWLQNVGATTTPGQLVIHEARQDLTVAPDSAYAGASQPWMTAPAPSGGGTFDDHFTFNTPFNAAAASQCGRVVYSDFHVSASALVSGNDSCSAATDPLGRTTFDGCGFTQQCVCGSGSSASVSTCSPATSGTCNEPCATAADCADTSYTCQGAIAGGCGPGVSCVTSACTPLACTQNGFGNWSCPSGGYRNCDGNSHLCVCQQDADCPTGSLCVNNGQCGFNSTCSGTGAYDGSNCTTTATCTSSNGCPGSGGHAAETCGASATATCPLAGHVCNGTKCACAADSDCPPDGKCLNAINNCPTPALCTATAGTAVDGAECTIATNNTCVTNSDCGSAGGVETCRTKGTCSASGVACVTGFTCGGAACNWQGGQVQCTSSTSATCTGSFGSQTCECTDDNQCGSGKCINGGQCAQACNGTGAADGAECTLPSGKAQACTNSSQCTNDSNNPETCTGKLCNQNGNNVCNHDADCPGTSKCVPSGGFFGNCQGGGSGPCTGSGPADSAQCTLAGQPATCTNNNSCVQSGGTTGFNQAETCQAACVPRACSLLAPCPNGLHCSNAALGGVCECGNDNDCPGSAQCLTTAPGCPAPPCTGTGTPDSANCAPVAATAACPSSCGSAETCVASTTPTICPLAGHVCGSAGTCLCARDSDCSSGHCINAASNCPTPSLCSGSGTGDSASCEPITNTACTTSADCANTSATDDTVTCARPDSCATVACSGYNSNCPGTTQCSRGSSTCQCMNDSDCPSGHCVPTSANNDCMSYRGSAGTCTGSGATDGASCQVAGAPTSCTASSQCGNGETCASGGASPTLGQCNKTCTSSAQCTGHETCSPSGTCADCTSNASCTSLSYQATCVANTTQPVTGKCCFAQTLPESPVPTGSPEPPVDTGNCGTSSRQFPESCTQAPLSAQEKALEFMFFDITACVQPDQGAPPPPPPPPLTAQTFPLDFTASCSNGTAPRWRELDFTATFPSPADGSSISITAQTGPIAIDGGLASGSLVPSTPVSLVSNDQTSGSVQVLLDTGAGGYKDAGTGAGLLTMAGVTSEAWLHLLVTLTPTTGGGASPTLVTWNVVYDCPASE